MCLQERCHSNVGGADAFKRFAHPPFARLVARCGAGREILGMSRLCTFEYEFAYSERAVYPGDLVRAGYAARDLARRARQLARGLTQAADRERLNRFADETDERAAGMEAEAQALLPITPRGPE